MSVEKNRQEAERWLSTAKSDFESANVLLRNARYAHACFHAQQSAEKAIKAIWHLLDADPWGHSIRRLIQGLSDVNLKTYNELIHLEKPATLLDRFYIPTRYPNGLPDLTPDEAYLEEDALGCIDNAKKIIDSVKAILK
jgi:HEPN domain-containing protein